MASDNMFLENLEEFVFDENKVVTYKWLSSTLDVHVNQAKQMLYAFVDKHRNKKDNDDLSVVYFVSGTKKSDKGYVVHRCFVLPEERLEAFKSTLSVLTSCHIYSVQKARLKDSNALYITDYEKRCEALSDYNKHSAIQCKSAVLRSQEELKKLRGAVVKQSPNFQEKSATNKATNGHEASTKSKPVAKTGIAGMFAAGGKTTAKKQTSPETKVDSVKNKEQSESSGLTKGKGGGMMTFFSKQTAKVKEEKVESTEQTQKEASSQEKSPPQKSNLKSKGKKTQRTHSDDEPQKNKRRRIRNDVFDSSSEEEDMEPESPVPSPPPRDATPPREATPPRTLVADTPSPNNNTKESKQVSGEKRRKRKRKLVAKTTVDEDGFMVTEKVWESDSTDASEVEEPPAKSNKDTSQAKKETATSKKKPTPDKKTSPAKGNAKQASLMSFFKKK